MATWNEDQEWEKEWHGDCANSLNEELKQLAYAKRMGLVFTRDSKTPYNLDMRGKSVLDIGGGPYSLLLKAIDFSRAVVADPCPYPEWVYRRYSALWISTLNSPGEDLEMDDVFDEVWIYNVLQHVQSPQLIASNARKLSKIIRIFEWIETGVAPGHPHNLTEANLNEWFGGLGKVEDMAQEGLYGQAWYGIFKGDNYGK